MRRTSLYLLTIISLTLLLFFNGCAKQEKLNTQNAKKKKVDKFIEDINKSIKRKRNFDHKKKIKSYNLTDEEFVEVQKELSKDLDDKYFNGEIDLYKTDDYSTKFAILYSVKTYIIFEWKKNLTSEEIVVKKIMPIINEDNDILKVLWLPELSLLLMDIHNGQKQFKEEDKLQIADTLISHIINNNNEMEIRYSSFKAWIFCENRKEKIYKIFDQVKKDDELFRLTGKSFWFFLSVAPLLYEKMLEILENHDKYSEKQVMGALYFFSHDKGIKAGNRIEKLRKLLIDIKENENRQQLKDKAILILKFMKD